LLIKTYTKSFIVEKYTIKSMGTKFSLLYSPQLICNCPSKCSHRTKDGAVLKEEQANQLNDIKQCKLTSSSIEPIQHNISNHFKILHLQNRTVNKTFIVSSTATSKNSSAESSAFVTCNDCLTVSTVPPYTTILNKPDMSKQPQQPPPPDLNQLLMFLNDCERNAIVKAVRDLEHVELKKLLGASFETFNKLLFNNFLGKLAVRWSSDNKFV
jgi:hypothetical protein